MDWLRAHVDLRLDAYRRHALFVDGDRAHDKISTHLTKLHSEGEVRALERDGELEAVVAWVYDEESWFGPPVYTVAVDHRLDADVQGWLRDTFGQLVPTLDAEWDFLLDASYVPAYRVLRGLGVGVDSVQLVGDVDVAHARLAPAPMPEGVRLEPMTVDDLDAMTALYAETFSRMPEYCWFGAHEGFLGRQRDKAAEALASDAHLEFVLRTDEGVQGHASATVDHEGPFFGATAGMSLCFAPALRGRGVLRPVYRRLLDGMKAQGARAFRGGTSQPPVMHLAREMGRTPQGVILRREPRFDDAHFAPFLPQ